MPVRGRGGNLIPLSIKVKKHERQHFNRFRIRRGMSQREYLLWLMDKAGDVVPIK